ncbi:alpha/beta hydrolase [Candidatus Nomurabacteria bacterium]|nr:alpha/beta hydrolase [Candidatus Nomurabacteria bacterium]
MFEINKIHLIISITLLFIIGIYFGVTIKNNSIHTDYTNTTSTNTSSSTNSTDTTNNTDEDNYYENSTTTNTGSGTNSGSTTGTTGTNSNTSTEATVVYSGQYTSQNVNYATKDGVSLDFNLIKPKNPVGALPVMIWIHGGGFGPGGTNTAKGFEDDFTKYGYAIAAIEYRSMEVALFPAQVEDIKGAIRYMRANSSSLGIDPNNIFVLGTSSGGLIASLTGVTSGDSAFEGNTGGNTSYSSRPTAVINLFGSLVKNQIDDISSSILPFTYEIFGCAPYGSCPDRTDLAIDNYLNAGDPPFLIIHGTVDQTVPYTESTELVPLMQAAGISTTFITATGYGHDKEGIIGKYLTDIISFMNQY